MCVWARQFPLKWSNQSWYGVQAHFDAHFNVDRLKLIRLRGNGEKEWQTYCGAAFKISFAFLLKLISDKTQNQKSSYKSYQIGKTTAIFNFVILCQPWRIPENSIPNYFEWARARAREEEKKHENELANIFGQQFIDSIIKQDECSFPCWARFVVTVFVCLLLPFFFIFSANKNSLSFPRQF